METKFTAKILPRTAVTATSGIVRRGWPFPLDVPTTNRSHRDFRNREAEWLRVMVRIGVTRSHRDFRNREAALYIENDLSLAERSHRDFRNREAVLQSAHEAACQRPQSPRLQES